MSESDQKETSEASALETAARLPLASSRLSEPVGSSPTEWNEDKTWSLEQWNYAWSDEDKAYMIVVPASKREGDGRVMCLAMTPNPVFADLICRLQQRNLWEWEMQNATPETAPVSGKEELARQRGKDADVGHDDAGEVSRINESPVDSRTLDL